MTNRQSPTPPNALSRCGAADPIVKAPTSIPMPSPRSWRVQVVMIFMPTGYTPASTIPVRNRRRRAGIRLVARRGISPVARAASSAEPAKNRRTGTLSARVNADEPSAPTTKPICTDIVSQALPESLRPHASVRAGTTADAENQTDIASSSASESKSSVRHLSFTMFFDVDVESMMNPRLKQQARPCGPPKDLNTTGKTG